MTRNPAWYNILATTVCGPVDTTYTCSQWKANGFLVLATSAAILLGFLVLHGWRSLKSRIISKLLQFTVIWTIVVWGLLAVHTNLSKEECLDGLFPFLDTLKDPSLLFATLESRALRFFSIADLLKLSLREYLSLETSNIYGILTHLHAIIANGIAVNDPPFHSAFEALVHPYTIIGGICVLFPRNHLFYFVRNLAFFGVLAGAVLLAGDPSETNSQSSQVPELIWHLLVLFQMLFVALFVVLAVVVRAEIVSWLWLTAAVHGASEGNLDACLTGAVGIALALTVVLIIVGSSATDALGTYLLWRVIMRTLPNTSLPGEAVLSGMVLFISLVKSLVSNSLREREEGV